MDLLWQLEEFRKKHEHQAEPSDWAIRMCEAFVARSMGFTDRVQWTELLRQKGETLFTFDWKSGSISDHVPDTQRWLDLIRQEEIAVAQAANPEKVNHVMEEKDLPINASGLQTLDNIWGLFETAVELNSAAGRREMYALARELSECQNLTDWIIKSQTENEGAQAPMACTQN